MREFGITTYSTRLDKGKKLNVKSYTWPQLADMLTSYKVTPELFSEFKDSDNPVAIKDVGWFVGGVFDPPLRKIDNLKLRSVLALDLDHLESWDVDMIKEKYGKWAHLVHSSHSHTEESPRLRIVFPLKRDITPAEYEPIGRKVAEIMGLDYFDDTTYQCSRIMFLPSCSVDMEDETYSYVNGSERLLDPDKVLALYKDPMDFGEWPQSTREKEKGGLRERKDKAAVPWEIPGVIGAFCSAYTIDEAIVEFELPYHESGQGDGRYTYADGSSVDGAVFYPDDGHLFSHHESDPAAGNRNAWDLVRLHKFGSLDDGTPQDMPIKDKPSQKAMSDFAKTLPEVLSHWVDGREVVAEEEFEDITDEETGETRKVKKERITYEGLRQEMSDILAERASFSQEDHNGIIKKLAASSLSQSEQESIATYLIDKNHAALKGVTKAGVLKDVKHIQKALQDRGTDGEVKDLQVEFIRNFTDTYYEGGEHLRRTGNQFWAFRDTHWTRVEDEYIAGQLFNSLVELRTGQSKKERRALEAAVRETQTSSIWSSLWRAFMATQTVATGHADDDPMGLLRTFKPRVINCLSGEIWFREDGARRLKAHDPKSLMTSVINVEYDKNAEAPEWDRFCDMIFKGYKDPQGMRRHLEEFIGYVLSDYRGLRTWGLLVGDTASGKSTIGKIIEALLGTAFKGISINHYDGSNTHATAGLPGIKCAFDDDWTEGNKLPDGTLKQLSEEKTLDVNPKGKAEFKFVSQATPIICANMYPPSRATDGALTDRALVFPLSNTIPRAQRDPERARKMMVDELPGLFLRFVKGASRLFKRGDFDFPIDCTIARSLWLRGSNPLHLFLGTCYKDGEEFVKASTLFAKYTQFMDEEAGPGQKVHKLHRNKLYERIDGIWGPRRLRNGYEGWIGHDFVEGTVSDGAVEDDEFEDQGSEESYDWDT